MTPAFASRRRAEEFDTLVSNPAREQDPAAAAYAELLEVVGELRAVPQVDPRPEFVADLRSMLVVEAARLARPVADDATRLRLTPRQRQGARERRIAAVLGGFAVVAASGSMAMASQTALPGDVLYPVKRSLENAQTNLQSDDAAKAEVLLAHAERRLQEAEQLTAEGADADTVAGTLQDFTDQSNQAAELAIDNYSATGDQDSIGDLRSFTADSMDDLDALGDDVPSDARGALITAAQSVLHVDEAAFQACPTCGDENVTELPAFATKPAALSVPLLNFEDSPLSVPIPPEFLDKVEGIAGKTPDEPIKDRGDGTTDDEAPVDDGTVTDPVTDPVTNPDDKVTNPLEDLGDQIKDGLNGDHSDDLDPVVDTLDEVVSGVDGLVDGVLGN